MFDPMVIMVFSTFFLNHKNVDFFIQIQELEGFFEFLQEKVQDCYKEETEKAIANYVKGIEIYFSMPFIFIQDIKNIFYIRNF